MHKVFSTILLLNLILLTSCAGNSEPKEVTTPEVYISNEPQEVQVTTSATTPTVTPVQTPTEKPASANTATTTPMSTAPSPTTTTTPASNTPVTITTPKPTITTPKPSAVSLITYMNSKFYYKISYPPSFRIEESDPYTVIIGDAALGGITVLVDKLAVDKTPKYYFESISAGKKKQLPDWTSSNVTEIKENNVIIGYRYDYSNTANGKKWLGKGMTLKKGGFGFYVVYTTFETEWKANQEMSVRCLDSFVLPKIASGSYSNPDLGVSLNLPKDWSLIETGSKQSPIDFWPPYDGHFILGQFFIETVPAGTTAQKWISDLAVKLGSTDGGTQVPFSFSNSITGHEFSDLLVENDVTVGKLRYIALVNGTKVYYFMFIGTVTAMDAMTNAASQIARSLVVSLPKSIS